MSGTSHSPNTLVLLLHIACRVTAGAVRQAAATSAPATSGLDRADAANDAAANAAAPAGASCTAATGAMVGCNGAAATAGSARRCRCQEWPPQRQRCQRCRCCGHAEQQRRSGLQGSGQGGGSASGKGSGAGGGSTYSEQNEVREACVAGRVCISWHLDSKCERGDGCKVSHERFGDAELLRAHEQLKVSPVLRPTHLSYILHIHILHIYTTHAS
jgi:hypothetical protein